MAWKHLGETFDIHGGGIDLVFPHHENEIAQTRCAFHSPVMADFWMHNGFLQVEGRKMAKSEGNFVTIRELLADWPGEVLRLNMLRTHYRQPIDWTMAGVLESQKVLDHWYDIVADTPMPIGVDADKVNALVDARNAARKAKNFREADRIRDELKAMNIELEDHKDGTTTWKASR